MVEAELRAGCSPCGDVLSWSGADLHVGDRPRDSGSPPRTSRGLVFARPDGRRSDVPVLSQPTSTPCNLARAQGRGRPGRRIGSAAGTGRCNGRLAEAESTMIRAGTPDIQMTHTATNSPPRRRTAQSPSSSPDRGTDRHRAPPSSDQRRTHFEASFATRRRPWCAVLVSPIVGFTALTQTLSPQLSICSMSSPAPSPTWYT